MRNRPGTASPLKGTLQQHLALARSPAPRRTDAPRCGMRGDPTIRGKRYGADVGGGGVSHAPRAAATLTAKPSAAERAAGRAEHFHLVLDNPLDRIDYGTDQFHDRVLVRPGRQLLFQRRTVRSPYLAVDVDLRDAALDGTSELVVGCARPSVQTQVARHSFTNTFEQA